MGCGSSKNYQQHSTVSLVNAKKDSKVKSLQPITNPTPLKMETCEAETTQADESFAENNGNKDGASSIAVVDDIIVKLNDIIPRLLEETDYTRKGILADIKTLGAATKYNPDAQNRERIINKMVDLGIVDLFLCIWKQLSLTDDFPEACSLKTKNLLRIFWNGTGVSAYMRQTLIEKDFITFIFSEILRNKKLDILHEKPTNTKTFLIKAGMGILHNFIQHCDVLEILRSEGIIELMEQYRTSKDSMVQCKAVILLSHSLDESQTEKLSSDNKNISFIFSVLKSCLGNSEAHFSKRYGYNASEVVETLNRMAVNDGNKEMIVTNGGLPYYVQMLEEDFTPQEQTLAAKGLWTLAFNDKSKEAIKSHPGCVERLEHLSKSSNSEEVKRAAQGALWILRGKCEHQEHAGSQRSLNEVRLPHVMISYQWDTKPIMIRVRDILKEAGYRIWMDIDNMGGSTLEAMADAVEQAAVVLVAMSRRYKESPSCRTEAEYTYELRKDFIPLRLQLNYKADGWLGIMVGTKLWFDFAKPEKFQVSVSGLIKELGERGRDSQNLTVIRQISQPLSTSPIPSVPVGAASWTQSDVTKWLGDLGFSSHITKFVGYDGSALLELKEMFLNAPEFFYTTLRKDLNFTLLQILMFQKALKSLK